MYPIFMFEDNKAYISFFGHPGNHRNSKHIDYRHHLVREGVQRGDIRLVYIETMKQIADILTQALDKEKFIGFRNALVVSCSLLKIVKSQKKSLKVAKFLMLCWYLVCYRSA